MTMPIAELPGVKKAWNNKILMEMGIKITKVRGTKYPVNRAIPKAISVIFKKGIKYPPVLMPANHLPAASGKGGAGRKLRNALRPKTRNTNPSSTLAEITVTVLVFCDILLDFIVEK